MFWRCWRWAVLVLGMGSAASAVYFFAATGDGEPPSLGVVVSVLGAGFGGLLFILALVVGAVVRLARRQAK